MPVKFVLERERVDIDLLGLEYSGVQHGCTSADRWWEMCQVIGGVARC